MMGEPPPMVNGSNARLAVIGAILLLISLIAAITIITIESKEVPEILVAMASILVGFLAGTRVVPPSVADMVKKKDG